MVPQVYRAEVDWLMGKRGHRPGLAQQFRSLSPRSTRAGPCSLWRVLFAILPTEGLLAAKVWRWVSGVGAMPTAVP